MFDSLLAVSFHRGLIDAVPASGDLRVWFTPSLARPPVGHPQAVSAALGAQVVNSGGD